jgi:hypothetical protein
MLIEDKDYALRVREIVSEAWRISGLTDTAGIVVKLS